MAAAKLFNLLSEKEIAILGDEIHPNTEILDLTWSHLVELGFLFMRTELNGVAPGGHVAIIAVDTLSKRAVEQNYYIGKYA